MPRRGQRSNHHARQHFESLFALADIRIGGARPWDIQLNDASVPARVLAFGNLGLGESYMDGHWDCANLDQMFDRLLRARLSREVRNVRTVLHSLRARLLNLQTARRAWKVGRTHYDLGNSFYAAMLDKRMTYTCAFWEGSSTLDEAQEHKLDLVCRKLDLQPGMRMLDIGCGWGGLMQFAAKRYGVHCTGVTISTEQAFAARERCAGLPVDVLLSDYRKVDGTFDRIVSLGMFEHVGRKNHNTYMQLAERCLADDGLFLLHTIGCNEIGHGTDPWIDRYIFPNGEIPTIADIGRACENRFVIEDLHNFGADYDRTLMAWHSNFDAQWPQFADDLGPRFCRMWKYYLLSCAGAFRARDLQLWQWILSKPGRPGVYRRVSAKP
ncbi:cyclopropane fatty acyl phospholipid synthase [Pseudomonas fluorescens]|uniref:cyclopropane fatty acyl phospholipid synthase n=1 Tax=Pseudomonas fluorescens TaxID=294 RepID=UPI003F5A44E7